MSPWRVSDPRTRVRDAHRRLLDGFAAFQADDADELRGLRAVLLQELGPHARLEEAAIELHVQRTEDDTDGCECDPSASAG